MHLEQQLCQLPLWLSHNSTLLLFLCFSMVSGLRQVSMHTSQSPMEFLLKESKYCIDLKLFVCLLKSAQSKPIHIKGS